MKYEGSTLQEPQKEKFLKKLLGHMETAKPFQEPELTISQLGGQLKIPPYSLSQVINEKLQCNFLDFINGYRVEAAKKLLADKNHKHLTILSIAYEVGFNSKTAFYSAFKKQTGKTPTAFRK